MYDIAVHFVIGTAASLLLFLVFTWLSGTRGYSAPFAVVFIGFTCALLAHFVSPWATPVVLTLYGIAAALECRNDRMTAKRNAMATAPDD